MFLITKDIAKAALFDPLVESVNELYIISAYATPTMLSWYIKNLYHKTSVPIKVYLLIGMIPFDGISASIHDGFVQIIRSELPQEIERLECSYIYDKPSVHSNIYIWAKDGMPLRAFSGSANFIQSSFVGHHRQEVLCECDAQEAMTYYHSLIDRSIYAHHSEVEEYIVIHPTHPILDRENTLVDGFDILAHDGLETVCLSLVTRSGEPGKRSGLNWGQRPNRNPNEAYIPLPIKIANSGFFPLEKKHFVAITDDRHQLILRIEQQNNKAITTPARNSDLGEYFRNRLGLANGAFISRETLEQYGRKDVVFVKLDEETYYMDFSV